MLWFKAILLLLNSPLVRRNEINEDIQIVTEHLSQLQIVKEGKLSGHSTTIVRAVLEQLVRQEEIQVQPCARDYKKALDEKNTLIFTIRRTTEREHVFKWVGQLHATRSTYFYTLRSRPHIQISSC